MTRPVESIVPMPEPVAVRNTILIAVAVSVPVPEAVAWRCFRTDANDDAVPVPDAVAVTEVIETALGSFEIYVPNSLKFPVESNLVMYFSLVCRLVLTP